MSINITFDQLQTFFVHTRNDIIQDFVDPINQTLAKYNIDTQNKVCMFMAQVGEESGGFNEIVENLNYSAQGLKATFPKYFQENDPNDYARNPEKIANLVYANRMGNGDSNSGDGYTYRGRGLIQITGKNNYQYYASFNNMKLADAVSYLETPTGACDSAGWYWSRHNLNNYADKKDVKTVTLIINGGYNNLDRRIQMFQQALTIFS